MSNDVITPSANQRNHSAGREYKQTEVGVIPEDWGITSLSELLTAGPKNGYSGRSGKESKGTPTLSLSATSAGRLILNRDTVKSLDEVIDAHSELFLRSGDVLVQRSNTLELVGTTAIFHGPSGVYVYPDLMMRLRFKEESTAHWFWRYANSALGRQFFVSTAAGSTGSMPKVSGEKLKKMPLPLPPFLERLAIAAALSDAAALIESLEQLITKKRAVKQGAMQELLTGRRRLPGFELDSGYKQTEVGVIPEDWEVKSLGGIGEALIGLTYKPSDVRSDGTLVLRSSNIRDGSIRFDDNVFVEMHIPEKIMARRGDILICVRNGSRNLIGKCALLDDRVAGMTFGAFMAIFRTRFCNFIFQQFKSNIIKRQIDEHLGATINQRLSRISRSRHYI